jgi:cyclophilin family peptidyl-prolyl cis-trans isomerase
MRRLTRRIWDYLTFHSPQHATQTRKPARPRLELEYLENRTLMTATASGVIRGIAFLDANGDHARESNELLVAGAAVTLTGKTTQNVSVNLTINTSASGSYRFGNVLPGTYQLHAGPVAGLMGSGAAISIPSFTLAGGQTVTDNFGFTGKLSPSAVSLAQFLTTSSGISIALGSVGPGSANVNFRPDNAPIVSKTIPAQAVLQNASPTNLDLAGFFTDPDYTNSTITIVTNVGNINMTLFDKQDPQTVQNFIDYINTGRFNNNFFFRLAQNFILQAGGATLTQSGNNVVVTAVSTNPAVPSEFHTSNTAGTLAMALPGDPNGGTDQWFINLVNNAASLDKQSFTVFGKVADAASQAIVNKIANISKTNIVDESSKFTTPGFLFNTVPLRHAPNDTQVSDFFDISKIVVAKRDEVLTYKVLSNSNGALVNPVIDTTNSPEWLTLNYTAGMSGTADIVVQATDRYGATVTQTIKVTVGNVPTISNVAIAADNATSPTKLTATPTATDPQGLPVTFTYQWLRNGTAITGQTASTLTLSTVTGLAANDTLSVTVTPHDSAPFTGAAFTSSAVTVSTINPIKLKLPAVSAVAIAPDNASNATTLTATPTATDPLGKTLTFTYQWLKDGTAISSTTTPSAATATLSLTGLGLLQTDTLSVQVTPSDGVLTGAAFTSGNVALNSASPISIALPSISSITVTPDNLNAAVLLSATPHGTDPEGRTVTFSYQWLHNDQVISGQTAPTLSLGAVAFVAGDTFSVRVTPSDGVLTGNAFTSGEVTISSTPPTVISVPTVTNVAITPDQASPVSMLTATPTATNPNNGTLSFTYQWRHNGAVISGATSATLNLSSVTVAQNDTFDVFVTASDGTLTGTQFLSNAVTIATVNPITLS